MDDPQRHFGFIENWRELGYAHYLDWFQQVWIGRFPKLDPEIPTLQEIITRSGFWG